MKTGDRVVCIESYSNELHCPGIKIIKGQIYTIQDVCACGNCGKVWIDVGLPVLGPLTHCGKCMQPLKATCTWACPTLFRPIQYNSAHNEILNKEVVEEKLDVPIQKPEPVAPAK